MTVFIASLFLPYTIDFKANDIKSDKSWPSASNATVDGPGSTASRPSDLPYPTGPESFPPTPGATTEDERVFAGYTSRVTDEIPIANDRKWHGPSEPRDVTWGRSRKFNQPRSKAANTPTSSILSSPSLQKEARMNLFLDGSQDRMDLDEPGDSTELLSTVPWMVKAAEKGHGGLQNAVHAAGRSGILENKMWVGTLGMPTDSLVDSTRNDIADALRNRFESLTVFVGDTEFEGHYTHFCHEVLWPALHYQMQESPRHSAYDHYSWAQYVRLNEAFSDAIIAHWKPGDSIWVHDYHLLVLPGILREKLPQAEIGFFLHTPFPSSEVFRCLTPREQLLDGLLGANLIGFQTEEYRNHFVHSCSRLRGLETSASGVHFQGRNVSAVSAPMGIDPASLDELRKSIEVQGWLRSIRFKYEKKRLIVARDRLDVPGGIKQKLLAYEHFLKNYPDLRADVVLVQVISSASGIQELEAEVFKIAMRINTTYSSVTHQPLVLLQQDIGLFQFIALLSVAQIFMATNLREGMNLTSHDFVHCQDGLWASHKHGSLIISEFVGSASIFHERTGSGFKGHKLLVNPWDYKQCAEAINAALRMSPDELKTDWQRLRRCKSSYTAIKWHIKLQRALEETRSTQFHPIHEPLPLSLEGLGAHYLAARARIFFLEDMALFRPSLPAEPPSDQKILKAIKTIIRDPVNIFYITSIRTFDNFKIMLPEVPPGVGLMLENGKLIRRPNSDNWINVVGTITEWRSGVQRMMEYFQVRIEGSQIEVSPWSLIFRYDGALDSEFAAHQASELADQINGARGSAKFRIVCTATSVCVEPPFSYQGKGGAAHFILDDLAISEYPEFVLVAGGTVYDETLFCWANELARDPTPTRIRRTDFGKRLSVTTLGTEAPLKEARDRLPTNVSLVNVWSFLSRLEQGRGKRSSG